MGNVLSFEKYKEQFYAEFDEYYSTYPIDVEKEIGKLDKEKRDENPCTEKRKVYELARKCKVHVFRNFPFYFELCTGRARNGLTASFPPEPGIGGEMMRENREIEHDFFSFRDYYKELNVFISFFFTDFAHHCIGYEKVLNYGLDGIIAQAELKKEQIEGESEKAFLESAIYGCEVLKEIAQNFSTEALSLADGESNEEIRKNLMTIAETAAQIPAKPSQTFYEALNTIWFMREIVMGMEGIGIAIIGHFDRLLYPYYKKDIEEGSLTRNEAKDLLAFALHLTDAKWDLRNHPPDGGANTAMTIGGCSRNGAPVYNEVTQMILEIFEEQELVNPKLQARISHNHSMEYFEKLGKIIAKGKNVLSIFNDEILIPANVRQGKELVDARLYVAGGCQEPLLSETEINCRAYIYVSLPKLLLLILGVGTQDFWIHEGIEQPNVHTCLNYAEFYSCFVGKIRQIIYQVAKYFNQYEKMWYEYNPCPLYSATITGCIEKAKDMTQGGAKYNTSSFSPVGFGTLVDSLFAIKKVVFEDKDMTLDELIKCLNSNFSDCERTRAFLTYKVDKWGRDSGEINQLASEVSEDLSQIFSGIPNSRGGWFESSLFSNTGYVSLRNTEATPDGRKQGDILSRGMGPSEAVGPTNISRIMEGLDKLRMENYPASAVLYLDFPFSPNNMDSTIFSAVVRSFLDMGGNVVDFNITDSGVLEEAKKNPEKYKNLIVRVWGFSAYFTALDEELQNEMINRNRAH